MRAPLLYIGFCALIAELFLLSPGIDIGVTRLFYDSGQGFVLAQWLPIGILEGSVPWIVRAMIALTALAILWLAVLRRPLWRLDRKALIFLLAATVLGPGLIANTLLKDHWGRARPYQVVEFGGERQFTPAPIAADQCEHNCAFVSGHAALGFSLVSFALLLPFGWRRRAAMTAALGYGAVVGLGRIAAGRHFLSDVVYAGLIVVATSWVLYRLIVVHDILARPLARRFHSAAATLLRERAPARIGLWIAAIAVTEIVVIGWADRPLATYFRGSGTDWRPFFEAVGPFGLALPYLIASAAVFAVLRWGGNLAPVEPWAVRMREAAHIPALFFAAVAGSGIAVDILKVIVGRPRPKLLFAAGTYEFSWIGLSADHWSFPSGHAATAAALAAALWCLWPRPVLLYALAAVLVALSRVVTEAHYLSDVIMGGFIGVFVTRALAPAFGRRGLLFRPEPRAPAEAADAPRPPG